MRLLVTGGAGFIGSNFVRRALRNPGPWKKVTVLDALTYSGNLANLSQVIDDQRLQFVHGDIRNQNLVEDVMEKIDVVVNFAAESHVDRSLINPSEFLSTNVLGTSTLLNAVNKYSISQFVQVSTDEVYGSISEVSWD